MQMALHRAHKISVEALRLRLIVAQENPAALARYSLRHAASSLTESGVIKDWTEEPVLIMYRMHTSASGGTLSMPTRTEEQLGRNAEGRYTGMRITEKELVSLRPVFAAWFDLM